MFECNTDVSAYDGSADMHETFHWSNHNGGNEMNEQDGKAIDEYIEVHRRPDGRVAMVVRIPNDPNGLAFALVRDTYEECLAEWRKFDGWIVGAR